MERLGDHELIAVVGEGATSQVWRARRRSGLGQVVAVKRVRVATTAADRDRLRAEASVLQDLDHPHIVRVLDVLPDGDGVAIVMAYAPGGTLADLVAERGRLEPGEVVAVVAPLADALASAHRRGVVHGDVKPGNVLFTSDGEPLLADFGGNRIASDARVELTPEYAAPEALAGRGTDAAADVYALGAVAVELLTGAVPAAGLLDGAPGLDQGVAAVLRAALAADPGARPSAGELAAALRGAVRAESVRLPGPPTARAGAAPSTRSFGPQPVRDQPRAVRRAAPWLLGLVAVACVAALWVAGREDGPSCPDVEVASAPGTQAAVGDFDGDGCATAAAFTPAGPGGRGVLRVDLGGAAPFEVQVGAEGDELFVGDWDCDGRDRPALYRPSDGTVVVLDVLEVGASATAEPVATAGASVEVRTDDDGCDRLVPR